MASSPVRGSLSGDVYRRDALFGSRQWRVRKLTAFVIPAIMNSLKNRGLKDILILCADGLTGLKDAVATAFPQTEFQRCIVHQVRNTLKYVAAKDRKTFAADELDLKWSKKYPHAMKS